MKSNKEKRDYFLTLAKMANTEKQLNAIIEEAAFDASITNEDYEEVYSFALYKIKTL